MLPMKKSLLSYWNTNTKNISISLSLTMFVTSSMVFSSPSHAEAEKARNANSFIDSIGVVAHLNYTDTSYIQYNNIVKPRLKELGVRHIRTFVSPKDLKTQSKLKELATLGIKSNLVMDPEKLSLAEAVNLVKNLGKSVVESVEGPNEWNAKINLKNEYKGKNFPEGLENYQNDFYSVIKSNSATAHLPVLAPSIAAGNKLTVSIEQLGKVNCDINNMHSYPGGKMPSTKSLEFTFIPHTKKTCGENKPLIASETGYHTTINDPNGVSEKAAGKYTPRLLLEYFNRGIERTYVYELMNKRHDSSSSVRKFNWGLLRADGSPKKEFIATRNLIDILEEPNEQTSKDFALKSLDYTLKGNTENINHTLLQKKDGRFYLILWQEVPSYDLKTKTNINVPYRNLKLVLNTKISKAAIYKPNMKNTAVKTHTNPEEISIGVPDYLLMVELTP